MGELKTLRDADAGRAWLFKITRRELSEHVRRSKVQEQPVEDNAGPLAESDLRCACVLANLAHLQPEYAFALRRVVIEGVPIVALAKELGLTSNAANVRVHRARAALRARLLDHCGTATLRECLDCDCAERGCCEDERPSQLTVEPMEPR